jgi:CheY-like chemotaxis protein
MAFIIMLIDDDEDEHLFFQWSLEKIEIPITLVGAYSTAQAMEALKTVTPQLIFVDINLPGADGFECLAAIRHLPKLKDIPVYMYSTEITNGTIKRAATIGASGCLKKSRNHDALAKNTMDILKTTSSENVRKNLLLK